MRCITIADFEKANFNFEDASYNAQTMTITVPYVYEVLGDYSDRWVDITLSENGSYYLTDYLRDSAGKAFFSHLTFTETNNFFDNYRTALIEEYGDEDYAGFTNNNCVEALLLLLCAAVDD